MEIAVGSKAPGFEVFDYRGEQVTLSQYEGKLLLLTFMRHAACSFSRLRLEELSRHYPYFKENNLEILAFMTSIDENVKRYLEPLDVPFPVVGDPELLVYKAYQVESSFISAALGVMRLPMMFKAFSRGFVSTHFGNRMEIVPSDFLLTPAQNIFKINRGKGSGDYLKTSEIYKFIDLYRECSKIDYVDQDQCSSFHKKITGTLQF